MKRFLLSIVVALSAACFASSSAAAEMVQGFDVQPVGRAPAGWTVAITGEGTPEWRVSEDPAAPSTSRVLRQTGVVPKPSFPLCLLDTPLMVDGFVEVKFKTVSGTADQAAGVVWRAQDAKNYYVCRANALEDNVVLYKVENSMRTALDIVGRKGGYGVDVKVRPAQWQTLRVDFVGARFRVSLDGLELFEVEDATFPTSGRVGLWTKADSVTSFDDFRYGTR